MGGKGGSGLGGVRGVGRGIGHGIGLGLGLYLTSGEAEEYLFSSSKPSEAKL